MGIRSKQNINKTTAENLSHFNSSDAMALAGYANMMMMMRILQVTRLTTLKTNQRKRRVRWFQSDCGGSNACDILTGTNLF